MLSVFLIHIALAKAKVTDRESDKAGRLIKGAIWIRKIDNMNRDEGSY